MTQDRTHTSRRVTWPWGHGVATGLERKSRRLAAASAAAAALGMLLIAPAALAMPADEAAMPRLAPLVDIGTQTTVAAAPSAPTVYGEPVDVTASVDPLVGGGVVGDGTLAFSLNGNPVPSCGAVSVSGGQGLCDFSDLPMGEPVLPVGSNLIEADFSGCLSCSGSPITYTASMGSLSHQVVKADTTTALAAGPSPSYYGQTVSFTATVAADAPSTASPDDAQGAEIDFLVDGTLASTVPVDANGVATFAVSDLGVGAHTVTAEYGGDGRFNASATSIGHLVFEIPVEIDVDAFPLADPMAPLVSSRSAVFGQAILISATVRSAVPALVPGTMTPISPMGTVLFRDNGAPIGIGLLDASGVVTVKTDALTVGDHTITAEYNGNTFFAAGLGVLEPEPPGLQVRRATTRIEMGTDPREADPALAPPGPGTSCATRSGPLPGPMPMPTVAPPGGNPDRASVYRQSVIVTGTVRIDEMVETPGAGSPGGFLTLLIDGAPVDTQPLDATGNATFTIESDIGVGTLLPVGERSLSLEYPGSASFRPSMKLLDDAPSSFVVNKADTFVELIQQEPHQQSGANPQRPYFGENILWTVRVRPVAPGKGFPTGRIRIWVDGQEVGDVSLGGSTSNPGEAQLASSFFDLLLADYGFHTIEAKYLGDDNFRVSDSYQASLGGLAPADIDDLSRFCAFHVYSAPTETRLGGLYFSPGAPDPVVGQVVTVDAAVSVRSGLAASQTPTGTLTVLVDNVPVPGCIDLSTADANGNETGTVRCDIPFDAEGTYEVKAQFSSRPPPVGMPNWGSSETSANLTVVKAETSVQVVSAPSPSKVGESFVITATVSPIPPGAGDANGTVTFTDTLGIDIPGCVALPVDTITGTAVCTPSATFITALGAGNQVFTATYTPTGPAAARFNGSSGAVNHLVQKVNTATSIVDIPAGSSQPGDPVTIQVTVSALVGSATPDGLDTIVLREAGAVVGTASPDASGMASFVFSGASALGVGSHPFKAEYLGTPEFNGSQSATIFHVVGADPPAVTLTSDDQISAYGQPVTFTANGDKPGCTILFKDSTTTIGAVVADANGDATLTYALLPVGNHAMRAIVDCMSELIPIGKSPEYQQTVETAPTMTVLSTSADPSVYGQALTIQASVATTVLPSAAVTPTGTVIFKTGGTTIGVGSIDPVTGIATVVTSALPVGPQTLSAAYAGDGSFGPSMDTEPQTVLKADVDVTVSTESGGSSTLFGEPETFIAMIAAQPPATGLPTGTVDFRDGASPIAGCAARPVVEGVAVCTTAALPVGARTVHADYGGDANFNTGTGSRAHTVTDSADLAIAAVGDVPDPVRAGAQITLSFEVRNLGPLAATATVTGPLTLPAGMTSLDAFTPPAGWTCAGPGGTAPCTSDAPLPAGAVATFSAVMTVLDSVPSGMNLVTSAGVTGSEPDPHPENNAQSWRTTTFRSRR